MIACRDVEKAEVVAGEISGLTSNQVTTLKLDLASTASVRSAASTLIQQVPAIHFLINNAGFILQKACCFVHWFLTTTPFLRLGVMMCPQWQTEDGFEMQLGVNHLGHFLWTWLLLDTVRKSAPARIINLSSVAHTSEQQYRRTNLTKVNKRFVCRGQDAL